MIDDINSSGKVGYSHSHVDWCGYCKRFSLRKCSWSLEKVIFDIYLSLLSTWKKIAIQCKNVKDVNMLNVTGWSKYSCGYQAKPIYLLLNPV